MAAPSTLHLSWRSWIRIGLAAAVTLLVGAAGLSAGVAWPVRIPALVLFGLGLYVLVDVIIFTSSWRATASAVKVPTLRRPQRQVAGDDLSVEFVARRFSAIRISGPNGRRDLTTNPLVSDHDMQHWFGLIAD